MQKSCVKRIHLVTDDAKLYERKAFHKVKIVFIYVIDYFIVDK